MVELLHLWKNEAYTYRLLAEAVVTGHYTRDQAKLALAERMNIDAEGALESFLSKTEQHLEESRPPSSPQRDANRIGPDQAERPSPNQQ